MKKRFALFITYVVMSGLLLASIYNKPEKHHNPLTQVEAFDSISFALQNEGWTKEAADIIAGFETDLLDESDSIEYQLYIAYMED